MGKFKVPSWLMSQSSDADPKKQKRRSFSGFSQFRSRHESLPVVEGSQPPPQSHMSELARRIAAETDKLETYVRNNGLPEPAFGHDATDCLPPLPAHLQISRQEILHATRELESLLRGPMENIRWTIWNFLDTLSLQIINSYGIARLVPLDNAISLAELCTKTSLDSINLGRVLRHAMTNRIFHEPEPGLIAHTAASRTLARDAALRDWVGFIAEDVFPSAARVLDSLKAYPEATSATATGFNFAFDTVGKEPMFVTLGKDAERARRMGGAMASLTGGEGYELHHFTDNYDMSEIDQEGGVFVDIGGSHGFVCVALAKKWKKMTFVVQDLPKTARHDQSATTRLLRRGFSYRFMTSLRSSPSRALTLTGVVYFFRWIIHNYSTPCAVKLLKNLVPSLKPGSRVVINDHCLRDPGMERPWDEKLIRSMDLIMLTLLNAQERHEHEFRALFRAADERFAFKGVKRTEGCRMSIIEAVWEPGQVEHNGGSSDEPL